MSIQEALDYCLANPDGLSAQELVDKFPEYRAELTSLLGLASSVRSLTVPSVPLDRREAMKARLMAAAAARPLQPADPAATSPASRPVPIPSSSRAKAVTRQRRPLPWFLSPSWVVAAVALLLIAFTWWTSANSLPDSPFYMVKLASENIALNFAGSDANKAQEHLDLASSRLYDLRTMELHGELGQAQAAFDNYLSHFDSSRVLWERLTGQQHTDVAKLLYTSSAAGEVNFRDFSSQAASLPAPIQKDISDARAELDSAISESEAALTAANISPDTVIASANNKIAPLLTPVLPVVIPVPTVTSTGSAESASPTTVASVPSLPTVVVAPATPTASRPEALPTDTQVVSAPVATNTSHPEATATSISIIRPSNTPTPTIPLVSTSVPTPTSTYTFVPAPTQQAPDTSTPVVPEPTDLPTAVVTDTPLPVFPTDTPLFPVLPTDTPLPLPVLPTDTPLLPIEPSASPTFVIVLPTDTAVMLPSATATDEPPRATPVRPTPSPHGPPTSTPVPSICTLVISSRVTASCASAGSVSWSATISNPGPGVVYATYKADLLVAMQSGGGYVTVKSSSSSRDFAPGDTSISGTISYTFSPDVHQWRVRVSIDTTGYACSVSSHQSNPADPCQ